MKNAYRPTKLPKARRVVRPIPSKNINKKAKNDFSLIDKELHYQEQKINNLKLAWKRTPIYARIITCLILLPFMPIFLIILGFRFVTNKLVIPVVKEISKLNRQI